MFKLEGLHMVHVPVTVEQVALQGCPGLLLCIPGLLGFVLIIAVAGIPVSVSC